MPDLLIDVRCLQDPNFAERGIGRHALALLRHARDEPGLAGARLTGLVSHELPPLLDEAAALLDVVRTTAYTGAMRRPACHVQLSPMTHDPLFTARLLHHPSIPCAAAVYDFIPYDDPGHYLPTPAARLEYHISLRWLARHNLFLPISHDAAGRLRAILGVRDDEIVVTGAPLDPRFEAAGPGAGRHVLVIGGGDPRKDPECAVRAHAQCPPLQQAGVPLVVTGQDPGDWLRTQRATAAALGGNPALVEAPGRVDEAALGRLYADALCVAAPSRAEGFSLPVVEAMASGAPVLASGIPAHRELVDLDRLFPPGDDAALSLLLARATDPAWRAHALAEQALAWPRYRAHAVAGRFWSAVAARLMPGAAPSIIVGRRPRVAVLTPLPPARSGVADYSAAMCAGLGPLVELNVFTETPDAVHPPGAARVEPLSALPMLSSGHDRVVSILGNSHFHVRTLEHLLRYGGACIAHDGRMLDVYHAHAGQQRTERLAEDELGRPLRPREMAQWLSGEVPPGALILGEVAAAAEPLFLHARATVEEVRRRYGRTALHLPFCLQRSFPAGGSGPAQRLAARERLGFQPRQVVLVSFGFVHPSKAPEDCIWALDLLRAWGIDACLIFVGAPLMETGPLQSLCTELGLHPYVRFTGAFADERSYRDHLLAADVGIQLRMTGAGSVSGTLSDCIGAGLPSVASAALAEAADAPDYVRAVPDRTSAVLVAEAVADQLAAWPRREGTEPHRLAYTEAHGFGRYAALLCQSLGLGA